MSGASFKAPDRRVAAPTRRQAISGFGALGASAAATGCATAPESPVGKGGPITLEQAFLGRTLGRGVFRVPVAGVERRFRADLVGTLDGNRLTVVEDFFFDDGETDTLTWVFDRAGPGRWTGRREDTVGVAEVREMGDEIRLEYLADVRSRGQVTRLAFKDVIFRASDRMVLNLATVSRFGINIGTVRFELVRP